MVGLLASLLLASTFAHSCFQGEFIVSVGTDSLYTSLCYFAVLFAHVYISRISAAHRYV